MEYYSTKEMASLWNITPRRVALLAGSGRIPGAVQTGHSWLIPKDASKPSDPRKKQKACPAHSSEFPMFLLRFDGTRARMQELSPEERKLFEAQSLFVHNDLTKAVQHLNKLILRSEDPVILIGSYITLGFAAMELPDISLYERCILELQKFFTDDLLPLGKELQFFLNQLNAYRTVTSFWTEDRDLSIDCHYDELYPVHILNAAYTRVVKLTEGKGPVDTYLLELLCRDVDSHGYYFSSQLLHTYAASVYLLTKDPDSCLAHIRKSLDLAVRFDSYYPLAVTYRFLSSYYRQLLPEYPEEAGSKLIARCIGCWAGIEQLNRHFSENPDKIDNTLSLRDYEYIAYSVGGMKIREIAQLKGISEPAVSKHYASLYHLLGFKNKKELLGLIRSVRSDNTAGSDP